MAYLEAGVRLEWDEAKNRANQRKQGISLSEARELFTSGFDYLEIFDAAHSIDEDRFICIGFVREGVAVVVMTEPAEDRIRIISARWATSREEALLAEHMKGLNND